MAINNPIIADADIIQDTAVAIQEKDHGGKMEHPDFPSRIRALPTNLIPKTITENGVYNASSDNADGYDVVTVDVPERNTFDEYYANTLKVANIPSATTIPEKNFLNKTNLIDVIMPNVTNIGTHAFDGCANLALTSLPSGLTSIADYAFAFCKSLALTSLPSGITRIGAQVFNGCTDLALTSLPSGLTSIADYAFQNCKSLALTSLPSGLTSIGWKAFNGCTSIPYLDFSAFTNIPTVSTTSFPGTNFPFYFRDQQQLDEWAAATNWSTYANRFQIKPIGVI